MNRLSGLLMSFMIICLANLQLSAQSRVEDGVLNSKILSADRSYTVLLPNDYDKEPDKKYPTLYLLHGMTETNRIWFDRGHVKDIMDQLTASGEAIDIIIVAPNAGGRFEDDAWNGYFDMPGWKYETFFFEEFLPFIESKYRVIGNKQNRAIAGLSMGGGGATGYAQHHSDKFCAVYAMSALMTIPGSAAQHFDNPKDKFAILTMSVIENSCVKYVDEADDNCRRQLSTINWYVDCGDDDFLLNRNIEFIHAMRKAQIPVEFRVRDGGHTWEYWHSALYKCLPFVSNSFRDN